MNGKKLEDYFYEEMEYLRSEGQLFVKNFPTIASHLSGTNDNTTLSLHDSVTKLLESFAFLTGRLQKQTENLFPEVSYHLLKSIYPELLNDIPSMTLLQFEANLDSGQKIKFKNIPRNTKFYTTNVNNIECTFETFQDFNFTQTQISNAKIINGYEIEKEGAFLKLSLDFYGEEHQIPTSLTFYALGAFKFDLWEVIISASSKKAFIKYQGQENYYETEIEYNFINHYHTIYNSPNPNFEMLRDFITFPEMFLNFSVMFSQFTSKIELFIPINAEILNCDITKESFGLNIVPIANSFSKISEPFTSNLSLTEYPIIPDERTTQNEKVLTIKKVIGIDNFTNAELEIPNYFQKHHSNNIYWVENYHNIYSSNKKIKYISFVHPNGNISVLDNTVFFSEVVCTNENEAELIHSNTEFYSEIYLPTNSIHSLGIISKYQSISDNGDQLLKLISYLAINYLGFANNTEHFKKNITNMLNFFSAYFTERNFTQVIDEIKVSEKIERSYNQSWIAGIRGLKIDISFSYKTPHASNILLGGIIAKLLCNYVNTGQFIEVNIYQKWNLLKTFKSQNGIELSL